MAGIRDALLQDSGWFLGTDNHGQLNDTYAAAGLQIVGEFDYRKSETLARFADGISASMARYPASGSLIDYYNTADGLDGYGFATELTIGKTVAGNTAAYDPVRAQVLVDSIRAYEATRMRFFEDLDDDADRPLDAVRVRTSSPMRPTCRSTTRWCWRATPCRRAAIAPPGCRHCAFVEAGGNLVVTDGAAPLLAALGLVADGDVEVTNRYVGYVDFGDAAHPLNAGLRGVASQTYDTVPIGFAFGGTDSAPNWTVSSAAWEAGGGSTAGTNGTGRTVYGEKPLGEGFVRFLGALLPQPTEAFHHPYGLQDYAVTYTGYTLLENMLQPRS